MSKKRSIAPPGLGIIELDVIAFNVERDIYYNELWWEADPNSPLLGGDLTGATSPVYARFDEWRITSSAGATTVNARATILKNENGSPITIVSWQVDDGMGALPGPPSGPVLVADFWANYTSGDFPLAVDFIDSSSPDPTSWFWNFGDGNVSMDQYPPTHTYTEPGVYTVTLTVNNASGSSDDEVKTGYITVTQHMHVASISVGRAAQGGGKWSGTADVIVVNHLDPEQELAGATVTGFFNEPNTDPQSKTTNGSGVATFSSDAVRPAPANWCFTVTFISLAGSLYDDPPTRVCEGADITAPAAPIGLSAVAGDGLVILDWVDSSEPDLASYNVRRSEVFGGPYTQINISGVIGSYYTDETAINGTPYFYVVTAVDTSANESVVSVESPAATPVSMPPVLPTGLIAVAGDGSVILDWADNSEPDLASYNVWRSLLSDGPYDSLASGVLASEFVDYSVSNGTEYFYVVTAVDVSPDESGYSDEAWATPQDMPPAAPANLIATAGDGSVRLDWDANTEFDLADYNVYRSTTPGAGPPDTPVASGVTAITYVDGTVTNGTTYYYVLTAVDTARNESASSAEASATPQAPAQPLAIETPSLPDGTKGTLYSFTLAATGGTAPYLWSEVGKWPTGLSLDPATGVISGKPKKTGPVTFDVEVTDSSGPVQSVIKTFSITILP